MVQLIPKNEIPKDSSERCEIKQIVIESGVRKELLGPSLILLHLTRPPALILSLFADDTTALAFSDSIDQAEQLINCELNKLSKWLITTD